MLAFLMSTLFLYALCNFIGNRVEAMVPNYTARTLFMMLAGIGIGAISSAIGYSFFLLTIFLIFFAWRDWVKLTQTMGSSKIATKYITPTLILILFASVMSHVFSIETCDSEGNYCQRVFFERVYTPPNLR